MLGGGGGGSTYGMRKSVAKRVGKGMWGFS